MIYSVEMWAATLAAGQTAGPGPESGHVWVVRDVVLIATSSGDPDYGRLSVAGEGLPIIWGSQTLPQNETAHWVGRQVLTPGQSLQWNAASRTWRIRVSGYDLINY